MFIRRVKTRTTVEGSSYYSYRLVDNHREADHVRQRTLLNLGSDFSIAREQWPELTQRIEQIILGQDNLFPFPYEIEREAQHIAARILRKHSRSELIVHPKKAKVDTESLENKKGEQQNSRDLHCVDLNSFQQNDSRAVGGEAVALSAIQKVGLADKLEALGFNRNQLNAAIGNLVGRMVQPGSELSTHEWLQEQSALGELLDFDYTRQGLSALYRASDLLWAHHEEIEAFLYGQHCKLFAIEEHIVLYDLTNTFFEGSGKYNDHAAYGHSKEKRSDCPLVTLALVLDGSGFSRHSQIFPGNISEPKTLEQMISRLRTHPGPDDEAGTSQQGEEVKQVSVDMNRRPTIVMDAGIASEDNITWLKEQGYAYIVVSRKQHLEFDPDQAVIVKDKDHDTVRAMRVIRDGEVELYCHSEQREAKESAIAYRFSERFEAELKHLAEGLSKPRRLKSAKKICEKIGRLRQKYSRVARYYQITTETDKKGKNVTALHFKQIEIEDNPNAHPGVYCLRSNQTQWDEELMWSTYIMLTDLEAVFRSLKSELGMRPVFHQKTHRVEGHLFITLLAYNLVHQIRLTLKAQGINDSWETIRSKMSTQVRSTTSLRGEQGEQIHIRQSSYPNASQQRILSALKLHWHPGKKEKTIIVPKGHKT